MKLFRFVFFAVLLFASAHVFAQNDNGLGFYTKKQIEDRDAINEAWSTYLVNDWTEPQINYDYMNRVIQQSGGITISNDNSTVRTGSSQNKSAARQRQQMQKAQDEARHRAWLEQRQAEREIAAEQQRILDELKKQRELEEAQRKFDKAYQEDLNRTAGSNARLHDNVTYNATVGYDNMINHHAPGTERIQSVYLPSKQKEVNIDHIVSRRRSGRPAIIGLTGNEVPTTGDSDYDKAIEKMWLEDEARRKELPKVDFSFSGQKYWDELYTIWDGGQKSYMEYMMKEINNDVREVAIEKEDGSTYMTTKKVLPNALGINDKGQYVFESADGKKLFWVSPDGTTLQTITLEEHFWEDDNIIKKYKNGELKIKDMFDGEIKGGNVELMEIKNGNLDLKDIDDKELKELFFQLRGSIKMNLVDNSTTGGWQVYYIPRQQAWLPKGISQPTFGSSLAVSGGGKAELSGEVSLGLNGLSANGDAVLSFAEGKEKVVVGRVVEINGKHFLHTGEAGLELGLGWKAKFKRDYGWNGEVEMETSVTPSAMPVYGGIEFGGASLKCLDCD